MSWYDEPFGQHMLKLEKQALDTILPTLYGYHMVCMCDNELGYLSASSLINHRVLVNDAPEDSKFCSKLQSRRDQVALMNDSIDVVMIAHVLEKHKNPHQIIREAHRILRPEGALVITGINPYGLWYLWQRLRHPLKTRAIRAKAADRVRDWLKLLDFQLVDGHNLSFQLPFTNDRLLRKTSFLEGVGRKCWPFCSNLYTMVAIKRSVQLTPLKPKWTRRRSIWLDDEVPAHQYHPSRVTNAYTVAEFDKDSLKR